MVMYVAAIALVFVNQWMSDALCVAVALMWLAPDRRIEHTVVASASGNVEEEKVEK